MAKRDLPLEVDRRRLSYPELLSTLEMVDGEPVVVMLSALDGWPTPTTKDSEVPPPHTSISLVGELRRSRARHAGTDEFVIGTPFEAYPDHLAGGVLYLSEDDFKEGALTTYDGNDFFSIAISTSGFEILIQDNGLGYP